MNEETINLTLQFLQRTQLQGSETPAFNKVVQALAAELQKIKNPIEMEEDNGDSS